jgi:tRNA(Arg) A34 adenosine deaminase TadA
MRLQAQAPLVIAAPSWMDDAVASFAGVLDSDRARMSLAVYLAAKNVERGGGPFGAAVFTADRLVAVGTNQVLESGLSLAHAEVLALARAQQNVADWPTLPRPPFTLVTSAEPCCQCFGALIWAGVERVVCGAATEDVQAIGFDEGPKPERWADVLEARGISVVQGVLREQARSVLGEYARLGGAIYGPGHALKK